jgi:hypothetical protein
MAGTLSCHAPSRDLVKLPLYERNQSVEGGWVALAPFQKQSGGLRGVVRNVAILSLFERVHRFAAPSRFNSRRCLMRFTSQAESGSSMAAPFRGPFPLYKASGDVGTNHSPSQTNRPVMP